MRFGVFLSQIYSMLSRQVKTLFRDYVLKYLFRVTVGSLDTVARHIDVIHSLLLNFHGSVDKKNEDYTN